MSRVVIDTNVFVSSFFGGKPKQVIDLWKEGKISICLSQPVVEEYVQVLSRLGLQDDKEIEELLDIFSSNYHSIFTAHTLKLKPVVKADPDDDKFIECAVTLKAKYIITGDKQLLKIRKYINIKILTPSEFLEGFTI